jgi:hypothetical protein
MLIIFIMLFLHFGLDVSLGLTIIIGILLMQIEI